MTERSAHLKICNTFSKEKRAQTNATIANARTSQNRNFFVQVIIKRKSAKIKYFIVQY